MRSRNKELPLDVEIQRTQEQLHLYDGVSRAMREPHVVLDVVLQADDPDAARVALRERFGFDEIQATAVLDIQFRRATHRDRQRVEDLRQELIDHLSFLQGPAGAVT